MCACVCVCWTFILPILVLDIWLYFTLEHYSYLWRVCACACARAGVSICVGCCFVSANGLLVDVCQCCCLLMFVCLPLSRHFPCCQTWWIKNQNLKHWQMHTSKHWHQQWHAQWLNDTNANKCTLANTDTNNDMLNGSMTQMLTNAH